MAQRMVLAFCAWASVWIGACESDNGDESTQSATGRSAMGECSASTQDPTCSGEEAYEQCLTAKCDSVYQECFGSGYASGTISGPCAATVTCMKACNCGDLTCEINCAQSVSAECQACDEKVDQCEQTSGCQEPVCDSDGHRPGSSGTESLGQAGNGTWDRGGTESLDGAGGHVTANGGQSGDASVASGGGASVCPYKVSAFSCEDACGNLKSVAARCQNDPSLSVEMQGTLTLAAAGPGIACTTLCKAESPAAPAQWGCFQGVPSQSACTDMAGCTLANCP
ncbi:hypothetical protein ACFL5O_04035 [Myxococcota bacterium]